MTSLASTETTTESNLISEPNDDESSVTIVIIVVVVVSVIITIGIVTWFRCKKRRRQRIAKKAFGTTNLSRSEYETQHTNTVTPSDDGVFQPIDPNSNSNMNTYANANNMERGGIAESRNNTVVTQHRLNTITYSGYPSRFNGASIDTMTMPMPNSHHGSVVTVINMDQRHSDHRNSHNINHRTTDNSNTNTDPYTIPIRNVYAPNTNHQFAVKRTLSERPINESESESEPPSPPPPTKSMMDAASSNHMPCSPATVTTAVSSSDASVYAKQEKYLREEMNGKSNRTLTSTISGSTDNTTLYKLQNRYNQEEIGLEHASMTAKHTISKPHHVSQPSDTTDFSLYQKQIQYLEDDINLNVVSGAHTAVV